MLLVELDLHELSPLAVGACDYVPHILEDCVELDQSKTRTRQKLLNLWPKDALTFDHESPCPRFDFCRSADSE